MNEKELIRELKEKLRMIREYHLILSDKMISDIYEKKDILKNQFNYSDEDIKKIFNE